MLQAGEVHEGAQAGLQLRAVQEQALQPSQRGQRPHAGHASLGQLRSALSASAAARGQARWGDSIQALLGVRTTAARAATWATVGKRFDVLRQDARWWGAREVVGGLQTGCATPQVPEHGLAQRLACKRVRLCSVDSGLMSRIAGLACRRAIRRRVRQDRACRLHRLQRYSSTDVSAVSSASGCRLSTLHLGAQQQLSDALCRGVEKEGALRVHDQNDSGRVRCELS